MCCKEIPSAKSTAIINTFGRLKVNITRVIICNYMHDFLSQSEEKIDVLFTIATTIWEITEISNWENGVGSGWIFRMVLVIDCYVS